MPETTLDHETSTLLRYLDAQRDHVLGILDGLDDEALRQPVLPSGWTCLGLIQHLTHDVERFWFSAVVDGDQQVIDGLAGVTDAWKVDPATPSGVLFERYRQEIERSNAVIRAKGSDAAPAWWPVDLFGDFRLDTVREIVLHVVAETACHAGHLDAVRELIDGRLWLVIDG